MYCALKKIKIKNKNRGWKQILDFSEKCETLSIIQTTNFILRNNPGYIKPKIKNQLNRLIDITFPILFNIGQHLAHHNLQKKRVSFRNELVLSSDSLVFIFPGRQKKVQYAFIPKISQKSRSLIHMQPCSAQPIKYPGWLKETFCFPII